MTLHYASHLSCTGLAFISVAGWHLTCHVTTAAVSAVSCSRDSARKAYHCWLQVRVRRAAPLQLVLLCCVLTTLPGTCARCFAAGAGTKVWQVYSAAFSHPGASPACTGGVCSG